MAERVGVIGLAFAALLTGISACAPLCAQSASGSLAGKLTDMHANPLAGVTVIARNQANGLEAHTVASRNGSYEFRKLSPGTYTLQAISPLLGRGQIDGVLVSPHHTARVQISLAMEPYQAKLPMPAQAEGNSVHLLSLAPEIAQQSVLLHASIANETIELMPAPTRALPVLAIAKQSVASISPRRPHIEPQSPPINASTLPPESHSTALILPATLLPAPVITSGHPLISRGQFIAGGSNRLVLASPFMVQVAISAARSALRLVSVPPGSLLATARAGLDMDDPDTTLTSQQLQSLPLRGRDWRELAQGTPSADEDAADESRAVTAGPATSLLQREGVNRRSALRSDGFIAQNRTAYYDGPISGESAIRAVRILSPTRMAGSGIDGFASPATEFRRGGAGLHGQLALYSRQNLLNARNPFSQWVQETAPAPYAGVPTFTAESFTPPSHNLRASAGLGGQLRYGRFGWFASVDADHRDDPAVSTARHPDLFFAQPRNDQMQVLAARLNLSPVDPVAEGLRSYSGMLEQLSGLLGPAPRTSTRITAFARLDWRFSQRQSATIAASEATWNSPGGGFSRTSEAVGTHSFGSYRGTEQWLLARWQAFLTPNLLLVTQGAVGRNHHNAPPSQPSAFEQTFNDNSLGRLPQIVVDSRYGFTIGTPARFGPGSFPDETDLQLRQQIDWAKGTFHIRTGFELLHARDASSLLGNQAGTYHYATVENFISDALSYATFGLSGQLDPHSPHNCDQTGRAWRDSNGALYGLGYLPCYSYYSQTIGPSNWWLATNDWAGYATAQGQPARRLTVVAALRWQRQQLPPPIATLNNPDLPLTQRTPALGNEWAPRFSLSWGSGESRLPILRLGYGMFYSRTPNLGLLNALTQTGSHNGDMDYLFRPTDNLNSGGAPPFPYVLNGAPGAAIEPGAVEFAPAFHNGEVHQAALSLEESLPAHIHLEAGAAVSLGRRLPSTVDANFDPSLNPGTITYAVVDGNGSGPIKSSQITVPFFANWTSASTPTGSAGRLNPNYQRIMEIYSGANSTWQAASLQVIRYGRSFTLHTRYTYSHATDWNPDGSPTLGAPSVFDPANLQLERGASNLDVRHVASGFFLWESRFKLEGFSARLLNGWLVSGTGNFRSGLPYTMRTAGSIPKIFTTGGTAIVGLAYGMNGYGGANRVYGVGRNTYRYQPAWKADLRLAKKFNLGALVRLQVLAESFNLFNHSNVTELESVGYIIGSGTPTGGLPTLTFLTGLKPGQTEFGQPLNVNATNFYRPREIQFGVRIMF